VICSMQVSTSSAIHMAMPPLYSWHGMRRTLPVVTARSELPCSNHPGEFDCG
jgi:hypothetical protein